MTLDQQNLLCSSVARMAAKCGDPLAEANALQYLPDPSGQVITQVQAGLEKMKDALSPTHHYVGDMLLAHAHIVMSSGAFELVPPPPLYTQEHAVSQN